MNANERISTEARSRFAAKSHRSGHGPASVQALWRLCSAISCLLVALAITVAAPATLLQDDSRADALLLPGSTIPIGNIVIERVAAGRVIYRDASGRRHTRNLEEVGSLRFAALPQLDVAEEYARDGEHHKAIEQFLVALVNADNDMQRLWVHARLARTHDIIGEYVQAASHTAAMYLLDENVYWRRFEPVREPMGASFPAAAEAMHQLHFAQRQVTQRDLSQSIRRMMARVEAIHGELKEAYDGPPIEPGTTCSGIRIADIRQGQFDAEVVTSGDRSSSTEAASAEPPRTDPPAVEEEDGTSPAAIARLLSRGQFSEAVDVCRRVARNLRGRDAGQFLYQYGRALVGTDRPADAAVMFTRCAIHYPRSEYAIRSLLATAGIYHDHYQRPDTALRLLGHAEARLSDDSPRELREQIAELRAEFAPVTDD